MKRILVLVGLLLCLGVLQNYSIAVSISAARGQLVAVTPSVVKQIVIVGIGAFAYWFCSRFKYMRWADISEFLTYLLGALLVAVLIPGIGRSVNGSSRWIGTNVIGLQPSQAAVLVVPLLAAKLFSGKYLNQYDRRYFRTFLLFVLAFTGLVALEPDFGTAFVIAGSSIAILLGVGAPFGYWASRTVVLGALALVAVNVKASWKIRMTSFINPLAADKAKGVAYQLVNSMFAVARGGVLGRGFMRSVQKFVHFPAQENDFVFAIFSEEFGLIGVTVVLGVFLWIVFELFRIASRTSEPFARVYVMALGVFLAVQAFVNIGVVVGLLPTTGVPLPFFSQGGNHIVFEMAALGIAGAIARSPEAV
ncbi:MAG TPA: FtsW/RodA/SpoVE family cell cycle protein [Clostridia bacterium]|nr:FtsW/RodA/SpoVE family cell cycle protein [Clostridia bacterium]